MTEERFWQTAEALRREMLSQTDAGRDLQDEEIREAIRRRVIALARRTPLAVEERERLEREVFHSLRRLDMLEDLLADPANTEIMVNGAGNIFVEQNGKLFRVPRRFSSESRLEDVIQQIVAEHNHAVNEAEPIADTRLPDGSRVCIVLPPVAVDGPVISIRRFPANPLSLPDLIGRGTLSEELAVFLAGLVQNGYNLFISGGTGSGKTTLLGALCGCIPPAERVVTIEDAAELQMTGIDNLVRLESRTATANGRRAVSIRDLVRTALRLRPDRIIVGECRGAEALEVLQAANTGHDGTLSTGHANSAADMLSRLETMVLMSDAALPLAAIRRQIASGIDVLIHLGRMRDGSRRVLEVTELTGMQGEEICMHPLYVYEAQEDARTGTWVKKSDLIRSRNRGS